MLPAWLTALVAETVAQVVKQILLNLPAVAQVWREANQSTMNDAPKAPGGLVDALNKEIADANRPH